MDGKNVFEKILSTSVDFTNSERASIFIDPKYNSPNSNHSLKSILSTGVKNNKLVVDVEHGIVGHVYRTKQSYICNDVSVDPYFYDGVDRQTGYKTKSTLVVPLWFKESDPIGVVQVLNKRDGQYSDDDRVILELISIYATMALDYLHNLQQLHDSENIIEQTRGIWGRSIEGVSLKSENVQLQEVYNNLKNYALSDSSIFIRGESGTGKEVITKQIHHYSSRKRGPLIAINCAAIPEQLFEAELFGVAKGAATGTVARKGKIEMADHGTLFLDEIGEMPLDLQSKLLRVLQDKRVSKLGQDTEGSEIDFRLVCATNKDLKELIKQGKFREDLYYRINVIEIQLPALRERKGDLKIISTSILETLFYKRGWKPKELSSSALEKLTNYQWPGNIRELQNRLENAYIISQSSPQIEPEHIQLPTVSIQSPENLLPSNSPFVADNILKLPMKEAKIQFELKLVEHHIEQCQGNKTEAARHLGITREGLRKILIRNRAS